jgi:Zinc carboxypeptidase
MRHVLLCLGMLLVTATGATSGPDVDPQRMRTEVAPGTGGYTAAFWPDGTYRSDVRSPSDFLGYPVGSAPASHADIVRYFEYLDQLPTAELHTYAESYEGRKLVYLVIASEANAGRLAEIRSNCQKLADPRTLGDAKVNDVIAHTPAVAWMAYGIHGDELSSCDAAIELAYQLLAVTKNILDQCVVIIDPTENPDGRTRWLTQLAQWNAVVASHDVQSMSHTGLWPYGRTNHYLFDLNRDWFALVHPESRGRTAAILEWMPHYLLDCHEMGPLDTYLFSPPREPFNPHMVNYIHKWWERVAKEHAALFDRFGWSYYTREWNEELFPGYGSSWAIYSGAVGFLFEQAGVDGSQIKRPDGTVMSYRETVHHQFVGSMANLTAVAAGRTELLNDYQKQKADNLRSKPRTYVFAAGTNPTRLDRFVEKLQHQRIEVERTTKSVKLSRARSWNGNEARDVTVPAGSAVVRTNQPMKQLVEAILEFDIRIPTSFLKTEKKDILARDDSRLYDTTGWSLPLAYGLNAFVAEGAPRFATEAYRIAAPTGSLSNEEAKVGFAFDGDDDRSLELLARIFEHDIRVWCARKPFRAGDVTMPRGSFLVRRAGNSPLDIATLRTLAETAGVALRGVDGGLASGELADLGGNEFYLLVAPRIALIAGTGTSTTSFGATWHLLDSRLRMRTSVIDIARVAGTDLSKYNVIVLPDFFGGVEGYKGLLGMSGISALRKWAESGGTLVADGAGAAVLADTSVAISSVRMRDQVLKDLPEYMTSLTLAKSAFAPVVDSLSLWEAGTSKKSKKEDKTAQPEKEKEPSDDLEARKRSDEIASKLAPRGAIVAVDLDPENWLAYGCARTIPALLNTNRAFVTKSVDVPARLAPADRLRLSGLLWEEARARWAESVYAARSPVGDGQAIVFVSTPNFRGYFHAAERLLLNALLLGPGCGTASRVAW